MAWDTAVMRSKRGVVGSAIVVLSLPLAVLLGLALGDPETILHFLLGAGVILVAVAVLDFRTTPWMAWLGAFGLAGEGVIFLLQGISDATGSASLHDFAYDVMGQVPERVLPFLFFAWCVVLLQQASSGRARVFGIAVVGLVILLQVVDIALSVVDEKSPGILKVLYLVLFFWFLLESRKPRSAVPA
jgi:hypothetical protein